MEAVVKLVFFTAACAQNFLSARLIFRIESLWRRFFAAFMFRLRSGRFTPRFFALVLLTLLMLAGRLFARIFWTPFARRFVARHLDTAQGPAEIVNLPFVVNFLLFRKFNQFQHMLHLFEGVFERFNNTAHIIHCPGQRWGRVLFKALAFHRGPVSRP